MGKTSKFRNLEKEFYRIVKKPKIPRVILPPNKVKPSKKIYDRKEKIKFVKVK